MEIVKSKKCGPCVAFGALAIITSAVGNGRAAAAPVTARAGISPDIHAVEDKKQLPKLAGKLGASWSRLQPAREAAALHVAENPKCDFVELAEPDDDHSTRSNIVIFVDCRNGERMYVKESDLKKGGAGQFQSDKTVDRASAIKACSRAARSMTTHPELAEMHTWMGASFDANKTTGNAEVLLNFDASNTFGVKGKFLASCIFPADGEPPEIKIYPR